MPPFGRVNGEPVLVYHDPSSLGNLVAVMVNDQRRVDLSSLSSVHHGRAFFSRPETHASSVCLSKLSLLFCPSS